MFRHAIRYAGTMLREIWDYFCYKLLKTASNSDSISWLQSVNDYLKWQPQTFWENIFL